MTTTTAPTWEPASGGNLTAFLPGGECLRDKAPPAPEGFEVRWVACTSEGVKWTARPVA